MAGIIGHDFVKKAILDLGVKRGDVVFVHADLNKFGFARDSSGGFCLALSPEVLLEALFSVLGVEGTIAVPGFSYTWPKEAIFSVAETPSKMGSFSEIVRKVPGAVRTSHPLLSVAAVGAKAAEIVQSVDDSGFGAGSPYKGLLSSNAKMVMVNVPFCSFKDFVEVEVGVPYRYTKLFHGLVKRGETITVEIFRHSVRYLECGVKLIAYYDGLTPEERRAVRTVNVEKGFIRCIDAETMRGQLLGKLKKDPFAFVVGKEGYFSELIFIHDVVETGRSDSNSPFIGRFAVDTPEGELWIWQFRREAFNRETVNRLPALADSIRNEWWSFEIEKDAGFLVCSGDDKMSGAEIALRGADVLLNNKGRYESVLLKKRFAEYIISSSSCCYSLPEC